MSLPLILEHKRLGATMKSVEGEDIPLHYSAPVEEHRLVRRSVGLADRSHLGIWRIEGPDASRFLQGLLSNDIEALKPGQGCYALSLTDRGKIVTDLTVYRRKEHFLMQIPTETRSTGFHMLNRFLISDNATLEDLTGTMGMLGVYGPVAFEVVASLCSKALPELPHWHFTEHSFQHQTRPPAGR